MEITTSMNSNTAIINAEEARALLTIIEITKEIEWDRIKEEYKNSGELIFTLISGWKKLENVAKIDGPIPVEGDFV